MGDIIHAMVALQYIKNHDSTIQIDWIVEEAFSKVLEFNPHIDTVYTINLKSLKKEKKELFTQIKRIREFSNVKYDLIIDAQGLIKSAIVAKLLGKKIAGFNKKSIREGFASFFYSTKVSIDYRENAIERNTKVLSAPLNFAISKEDILNKMPFLYFQNEDQIIYEYLDESKPNCIFIIGASWPSKMYAKEKFINVINALKEINALIVWGSEEEKEIAQEIEAQSSAKMMPKIDLNTLKALVANAHLVIGNDTGPTHMAWALNVPSITLFGNTPGYRNTYVTQINKIIESDSFVDPLKLKKDDFSICEIEEEKIIELSKELLDKTP